MRASSRALAAPTIAVRSGRPGVVLAVEGVLGAPGEELVAEAVHAALVAVRGPDRIHVDLTRAERIPSGLARMLRRLEHSGATVTGLPGARPAAGAA